MEARLVVLFACVYACSGHLCMLSPPQRTALMNINKAGSYSCFVVGEAPCGMTMPNKNKLYLQGGQNFTVVFQKNLNHFYPVEPGYFSVSIGTTDSGVFQELYRMADTSTPSLTIYTVNITVPPAVDMDQDMIIQSMYVPIKPTEPKAFYQCADVVVMRNMNQKPVRHLHLYW